MSPEQIEAVRRSWSAALAHGDVLVTAITGALTGPGAGEGRARWAADTITRLLLVLDRPAAFTAAVASELALLPRLTVTEVAAVETAVLGAVQQLVGDLGEGERRAWRLAFALFGELVADHLDPFAPT